jgi:hypothetical protein
MITREAVAKYAPPRDLSLTTPPNWTAIVFFACLSGLHFAISIPAFFHGRWEGYLSFVLAIFFLVISIVTYFARYEMTIVPQDKRIRLRSGVGPVKFERSVAFADVHAVRLTLGKPGKFMESRIEVLCDNEDIECPATTIPRQQALFLAVLMGVQLIKVCEADDSLPDRSDRMI